MQALEGYPIRRAPFSVSASGDDIVAPVTGKSIRILAMLCVAANVVTLTLRNTATTATLLSGAMALPANSGFSIGWCPAGWGDSISGEGVEALMSASVQVGGMVVYQEIG